MIFAEHVKNQSFVTDPGNGFAPMAVCKKFLRLIFQETENSILASTIQCILSMENGGLKK